MKKDVSYLSVEGLVIFTSQYLKNRKTCCELACLHCPYGFTLKKYGMNFVNAAEDMFPIIEEILEENNQANFEWRTFPQQQVKIIKIKNIVCGFLVTNHISFQYLFLKTHFSDQGLSKEIVESYFFHCPVKP